MRQNVLTMKVIRVSSFEDLHHVIDKQASSRLAIYRGVANVKNHALIPSVGRNGYDPDVEEDMLAMFKRHAPPFLGEYVPEDNWEWLALAQHHGLPTRFLDWTYNPLVATYFAVEQQIEADSAIYISEAPEIVDTEDEPEPFEIEEVVRYQPDHFTPRIPAQSGLFTAHPDPTAIFDEDGLVQIIIPSSARHEFKRILYIYGVHRGTLFPDLDGQASFIKWMSGK